MIPMRALIAVPLVACLALAAPGRAVEKPEVAVEAVVVPTAGDRVTILWRLEPTAGWHLYADLLNDAGYPPSVQLDLPAGWRAGPLQWPAAERHVEAGVILDHVYEGAIALLQEIVLPPDALRTDAVVIPAKWAWLACREMCVPGTTTLPVRITGSPARPRDVAEVDAARAALPSPAPPGALQVAWSPGAVELTVPGVAALEFHPATDCVRLVDAIADGAVGADRLKLRLRPGADGTGPVRGILHQRLSDGSVRNWTVDLPH